MFRSSNTPMSSLPPTVNSYSLYTLDYLRIDVVNIHDAAASDKAMS